MNEINKSISVGILTHPLRTNYGGILQAFALRSFLLEAGIKDVWVLNRQMDDSNLRKLIRNILYFVGIRKRPLKPSKSPQIAFIQRYLNLTPPIESSRALLRQIKSSGINIVVIGSDQVWNGSFARERGLDHWGLFLKGDRNIRRMSYAASVSARYWDYTGSEINQMKKSLSEFDVISVREREAADLLKKYLNLDVPVVADPTLLHTVDFYNRFKQPADTDRPYVFVYWLGDRSMTDEYLKELPKDMDIKAVYLKEPDTFVGVEEWLGLIAGAEKVITDSFHGMVFSLIFSRQFKISTHQPSADRMKTLLQSVGIGEKFITPSLKVDYSIVTPLLEKLRESAGSFIKTSLNHE